METSASRKRRVAWPRPTRRRTAFSSASRKTAPKPPTFGASRPPPPAESPGRSLSASCPFCTVMLDDGVRETGTKPVVEHHRAERARHRQRLGAGLGRLAHALLRDRAASLLLHPHPCSARAAAESALAVARHLDRLSDRGHQLARL